MAGIEKFSASVRQGAAIRRLSWKEGLCVTQDEPNGKVEIFEGKKSIGDGLLFEDLFATDWALCDTPDFGRNKAKKGQGKAKAPPPDPMAGELSDKDKAARATTENTGELSG